MLRKFLAGLVALALLVTPALSQMTMTGIGGGFGVPAASTTTYDPSNKSSIVDLTNGNLTATLNNVGYAGVRTVASNSGKCYYTVTIDVHTFATSIGFVNASFPITSGTYIGTDNNSLRWDAQSGDVVVNNSTLGTGATYLTAGDVANIAIDFPSQLVWVRLGSGNWNLNGSANPATGTGGFSFAGIASGPYYMAASAVFTGDAWTANFGATSYSPAAPSGFGNC